MVDIKIQTMYRENEAQTYPWSPPYVQASSDLPEVLLLNYLEWGKGLPAGQYEVEEINRNRKKRAWDMYMASVQKTTSISFKQKIISQIENDDWEFIAQDLEKINEQRMELAIQVLKEQQIDFDSKLSKKVDNLNKKIVNRYKEKVKKIQRERDKEIRRINNITKMKFIDRYEKKTIIHEFSDKLSDIHAFKVRLGYHRKNTSIVLCKDAYNKAIESEVKHHKFSPPNRSGRMKKHDCLREQFVDDTEDSEFDEYFKKLNFEFESDNKSKEVDLPQEDDIVPIKQDIAEKSSESENFDELSESEEEQIDPLEIERKRQIFMNTLKDKCVGRHERNMINKEVSSVESSLLANLLDLTSKEQQRLEEEKKILAMALIAQAERWKREAREDGIRQKQKMRETIRLQILDQAFETISQDLEGKFQKILRDSIMDTAVIEEEENIRTKMYDIDRADVPKRDEGYKQESMIAKLKDHISIDINIETEEEVKSLSDLGEINEAVQEMYQDILSMALDLDNLVITVTGAQDNLNKITRVQDKIKKLLDEDVRQPALLQLKEQVENIHLGYQLHHELNEDIKKMDRLCDTVVEIADNLYQAVIGDQDDRKENIDLYDDSIVNDEIINYLNKDTTLYIFKLMKLSHIKGANDKQMLRNSYKIMEKAKKLCKSVTSIAAKIHFFIFQNEYDEKDIDEIPAETESTSESTFKFERFKATHMERLCEKLINKLTSKGAKKEVILLQEKSQDAVSDKIDVCQIKKEAAEIIESIVEIWLQIDSILDKLESTQTIDKDDLLKKLQCIISKLEEHFGNLNEFLGMQELNCFVEPEKCDEATLKLLGSVCDSPEHYNEIIVDTIADVAVKLHNKHLEGKININDLPRIGEPLKSDIVTVTKNADQFVAIPKLII